MKLISEPITLEGAKKPCQDGSQRSLFFDPPLKDSQIIELQNLMMTPAIHNVNTRDIKTGRFLMSALLKSLNHYRHVGYLTTEKISALNHNEKITNIYKGVKSKENLDEKIEQAYINYTDIDFVWVELTLKLQKQLSENELLNLCKILNGKQETPVFIVHFKHEFA